MPKISAPTVREHHEIVKERLIDATERILRENGPDALSASVVAAEAGIARNSIYRYVNSVDDLRLLTLARYVPRWRDSVFAEVDSSQGPDVQLEQFVVANLRQTGESSHSWLMTLMRSRGKGSSASKSSKEQASVRARVVNVHTLIMEFVEEKWRDLGVVDTSSWTSFTGAILYASFKRLEHGANLDELTQTVSYAIRGLVESALRGGGADTSAKSFGKNSQKSAGSQASSLEETKSAGAEESGKEMQKIEEVAGKKVCACMCEHSESE